MEKATQKSVNTFLSRALMVLALLSLATPLIFSEAAIYQATLPRAVFIQLIVELMLACWIPLTITHVSYRPNWRNPILVGLYVFIGSMLITVPFGVDPFTSLFSNFVRMMGVVNILHLTVYIVMLSTILRRWQDWRTFFLVNAEVAVVIALFALYQKLFLGFQFPTGTIGNSLYLAGYMIPTLFSIGILFIREEKTVFKRLYPFLGVLVVMALVLAGRRGSLVGFGLSTFVGMLAYPFLFTMKTWVKRSVLAVTVLGIVGFCALVLVLRQPATEIWVKTHTPFAISRLAYGYTSNRFALFNMAIDGWRERPIAGYGYEQFSVVFHERFDPNGAHKDLLKEFYFDRAHNQFFDVLVASGVIGLLGFLYYLFMLLRTAWIGAKTEGDKKERLTYFIIGLSVVAYLGTALTMFDTTSQSLLFAVMVALLISLSSQPTETDLRQPVSLWHLLLPIALILPFTWYANIRPLEIGMQGEAAYRTMQTRHDQEGFKQAVAGYKKALAGHSWMMQKTRIRIMDVVRPYGERISFRSPEMEDLTGFLADQMNRSASRHAYDFETMVEASIANRLAAVYDVSRIELSRKTAQRAVELGPMEADGYNELAEIALFDRNADEAEHWENEALKYAGVYKAEIGRVYFGLARVDALRGEETAMFAHLQQAQEFEYPIDQDARLLFLLAEQTDPPTDDVLVYAHTVLTGLAGQPYVVESVLRLEYASGNINEVKDLLAQLSGMHPDLAVQLYSELSLEKYYEKTPFR